MNTYLITLGFGVGKGLNEPVLYDPKNRLALELYVYIPGFLYTNTNELAEWNVDDWDDIPLYTFSIMRLLTPCT